MRKTFMIVFIVHMLALLYFSLNTHKKIPPKKLIVKTFTAHPRVQEKIAVSTPKVQKHASKPVQQISKPTPSTPKPTISKKRNAVEPKKKEITSKPLKPKKEPQPSKVSHLLQELEETIAKIDEKRDKDIPTKHLDTPKWIKSLKIDTISEMENDSDEIDNPYQNALIRCLKENLNLPEIGQVKMEVMINEDGTVMKLRVIFSESDKNKHYLEKNLQLLKFPSSKIKKTFTFTFCNEL